MLFLLLWFFHGGVDQSDVIIEETTSSEPKLKPVNNTHHTALLKSKELVNNADDGVLSMSQQTKNTEIDYSSYVYDKENPVKIISVYDDVLPKEEKNKLIKYFKNLHTYGSYSAGKITNEFKDTKKYIENLRKSGGYDEMVKKLTFQPFPLKQYIDPSFKLVGAEVSGTYTENKGFNSIFRSYNNFKGKKLEVNEMLVNRENDMQVEIYQESINHYVGGNIPATIERLTDENGNSIFNLYWSNQNKDYMITGLNFTEVELDNIANQIIIYDKKNNE